MDYRWPVGWHLGWRGGGPDRFPTSVVHLPAQNGMQDLQVPLGRKCRALKMWFVMRMVWSGRAALVPAPQVRASMPD
jgi:hypothetical protein